MNERLWNRAGFLLSASLLTGAAQAAEVMDMRVAGMQLRLQMTADECRKLDGPKAAECVRTCESSKALAPNVMGAEAAKVMSACNDLYLEARQAAVAASRPQAPPSTQGTSPPRTGAATSRGSVAEAASNPRGQMAQPALPRSNRSAPATASGTTPPAGSGASGPVDWDQDDGIFGAMVSDVDRPDRITSLPEGVEVAPISAPPLGPETPYRAGRHDWQGIMKQGKQAYDDSPFGAMFGGLLQDPETQEAYKAFSDWTEDFANLEGEDASDDSLSKPLRLCNQGRPKRIASLRFHCPMGSTVFDDEIECNWHFIGWLDLPAGACQGVAGGTTGDVVLAVEQSAGEGWTSPSYGPAGNSSDDTPPVTWETLDLQEAGVAAGMKGQACGYRDQSFHLMNRDILIRHPCPDGTYRVRFYLYLSDEPGTNWTYSLP